MTKRTILTDDSGSTYLVDDAGRMAVLRADEWADADGQPDPRKIAALADYDLDEELADGPAYRHVTDIPA